MISCQAGGLKLKSLKLSKVNELEEIKISPLFYTSNDSSNGLQCSPVLANEMTKFHNLFKLRIRNVQRFDTAHYSSRLRGKKLLAEICFYINNPKEPEEESSIKYISYILYTAHFVLIEG